MTLDLPAMSAQFSVTIETLANLVTLLSFPIIVASIFAAFQQIRSQAKLSANEISIKALDHFYGSFMATSALRRDLQARFDRGDTTVSRQEAMQYYYQYWQQRELEWEYFVRGLISVDMFARWSENCVRHIIGLRDLNYYDHGQTHKLSSREIFENNVLGSILRRSDDCRNFYADLLALTDKITTSGIDPQSDEAYRLIKLFVFRRARSLKIKAP
ncbi:hypothetical protein ABI_12370 [Asticcacaulis biprosthecium C19]|uniref:Uncharacterized protein n=1 Tax=Asticcacaulis biprosthecium C19 TaxID=715226 RepID=F4QHR2_9CAUL|nr:hypothetical protein [Asticcacaulis biprosthecium]EGF92799.1 hypothetical protein ABI_12370 [Asticcacaulis biprosthecium C19]